MFIFLKVGSIGRSVQGRQLVYLKLSANPESRSLMEPMMKYVGNMHGNEVWLCFSHLHFLDTLFFR